MKFQGCLRKVTWMLHESYKEKWRVFWGSFNGVSRKFQGCFKKVSMNFQGSFKVVSRLFQGSFKQGVWGQFSLALIKLPRLLTEFDPSKMGQISRKRQICLNPQPALISESLILLGGGIWPIGENQLYRLYFCILSNKKHSKGLWGHKTKFQAQPWSFNGH